MAVRRWKNWEGRIDQERVKALWIIVVLDGGERRRRVRDWFRGFSPIRIVDEGCFSPCRIMPIKGIDSVKVAIYFVLVLSLKTLLMDHVSGQGDAKSTYIVDKRSRKGARKDTQHFKDVQWLIQN